MSTVAAVAEQRVVLWSVRWDTYLALVEDSQHAGQRMTYDQGVLEIMSPMMPHETAKRLIGRMIERFTEIRNIEIRSSASTTFRRGDLKRGFEADESYYIQHATQIRGKEIIDLPIDPPPDLVLEIELTRSAINKLRLFASMGIPEVWRYDGTTLWIGRLQDDGYREVVQSIALPGFPTELAVRLLEQRTLRSETEMIQDFAREASAARS